MYTHIFLGLHDLYNVHVFMWMPVIFQSCSFIYTCSFIWQNVAGFISCFHHSYNFKDENPKAHISNVAPVNTAKMAMEDRILEKLISLKLEFIWPLRSPDLNPSDFYLWGYIKDEIRRKKFTLQLLKWRSKSKRSSNQFLPEFCNASLENSANVFETVL